ncbi:MAG: JAB domain-containing protein [Lachnospiraceae bacterium]
MGRKNQFKLDTVSIRLVKDSPVYSDFQIKSPGDAIHLIGETICGMDREVVCVINLKADGTPINCNFASIGAVNYAVVNPRELLKTGILSNAVNMMLVHNHPGDTLFPSSDDIRLTDKILKLSDLVGIPLLDHIIVGTDNTEYFSFREKGIIRNPREMYAQDYRQIGWEREQKAAEKGRMGR